MFDPMADLGGSSNQSSGSYKPEYSDKPRGSSRSSGSRSGGDDGHFADEVHSVSIHSEHRTFYIDLKQSPRGKFIKVSEKSRNGKKSTIMLDETDLDKFIAALQEIKKHV